MPNDPATGQACPTAPKENLLHRCLVLFGVGAGLQIKISPYSRNDSAGALGIATKILYCNQ